MPLDNIKTKMQTQSTIPNCEKLNKDYFKNSGCSLNSKEKVSQSFYSTTPNQECNSGEAKIKYKDILSTSKIIYNENGFYKIR